jgi:hypothetical protein
VARSVRYREALENPPLLVVSDIETIEVHTNFTNTVKQIYHAVLDAYGWRHELSDEEILEHLLALNLARGSASS